MTDDKSTPNTEEPQELQADQLEEVDGGLTHPSLPNYYPVIGGTDFGLTSAEK